MLLLHDLQGNVVGEVGISEAETKVKTYNPTEFGVPNGSGAPPKYSWFGATGLASELASGTVTQDGETYVPQTGRPLQTQTVELPLPIKYYKPYEPPVYNATQWAETAGALRIAEGEQGQQAQGIAQDPSGAVPRQPIGGRGDEEGGGGIVYGRESSRPECEVAWALDEEPEAGSGMMEYQAEWACAQRVQHFELQACFYGRQGKEKEVHCLASPGHTALLYSGITYGGGIAGFECSGGAEYTGWVWGREYGPGESYAYPNSSINAPSHKWMKCEGASLETLIGLIEGS